MNPNQSLQTSLHLEEVWKQRSPDDQLKPLQKFSHHLRLALIFLSKSRLTSALSICSVAATLFILGLVLALKQATLAGVSISAGELRMSVFLRDNASEAELEAVIARGDSFAGLSYRKLLDKAAALAELRKMLSASPELLSDLDQDNPLPASVELSFDVAKADTLPQYAATLRQMPGVDSVAYDGQLAKVLSDLGSKLKGVGNLGVMVLLGLTLFLIATTVRISLYHEKDEIEIMSLVGAYHSFIQAPFIIGGALQGLFGSGLALLFLVLMEDWLLGALRSSELLNQSGIIIPLLSLSNIALLILLGVSAGIVGSSLASSPRYSRSFYSE